MKSRLQIIAIFSFAFFAFIFFASKTSTQTRVPTAGEKFKSIKVLNAMPADQLGKVMNMMSASLGVDCKFCHASNSADFEKEGFEHKDIARQMIKMTFELNRSYFDGRPEITCNTCHQGRIRPASAIDLHPAPPAERPRRPDQGPTVEEILARYETALGGRANLEKIGSRQIRAQRVEADGRTVEDEEILQKGAKTAISTVYPSKQFGDYTVREVFDGAAARKTGNGAPLELKADEAAQIKREAQLFANPNLTAIYPKIELRSIARIDGQEVYQLAATTAAGERENLYFDAATGLLVRRTAAAPTVLGLFQYQVDYADYKDFGGVRLPTTVKFAVPNIRWTRRVLEVKINAPIDDKQFTK